MPKIAKCLLISKTTRGDPEIRWITGIDQDVEFKLESIRTR